MPYGEQGDKWSFKWIPNVEGIISGLVPVFILCSQRSSQVILNKLHDWVPSPRCIIRLRKEILFLTELNLEDAKMHFLKHLPTLIKTVKLDIEYLLMVGNYVVKCHLKNVIVI